MADEKDKAYELYKQGKKYKEIAQIVGVSESAVKQWASRYWKKKKLQSETKKVTSKVTEKKEKVTSKKSVPKKEIAPGDNLTENCKSIKSKGGQPCNTNALKHGGYSAIFWDTLTEEEQAMIEEYHSDEEMMMIDEIKLLTVRERRLMQIINSYKDDSKQLTVSTINTKKTSDKKETQTFVESNGNIVMRLENELTNVQSKKTKAIEMLNKLRISKGGGGENDIADAWIKAALECDSNDKAE